MTPFSCLVTIVDETKSNAIDSYRATPAFAAGLTMNASIKETLPIAVSPKIPNFLEEGKNKNTMIELSHLSL